MREIRENGMEDTIIIQRKKSDMQADNAYQYHRLETAGFYFVPCHIEEAKEELQMTYQVAGMRPLEEIRRKNRSVRYGILSQMVEAALVCPEYSYTCHPQNLYCDLHGRARILERDIGKDGEEAALQEILALSGYLLQRKYSYEDYIRGGMSLLSEQRSTRFLSEVTSLQEAGALFGERQKEEQEKQEKNFIWVRRSGRRIRGIVMYSALAAAVCLGAAASYQYFTQVLPQRYALAAHRADLEDDLVGVIDALEPVTVEEMDRHEKYLLASAYIKGQVVDTFTTDTRELLLSRITYNSDETVLDYWIYLGRREPDPAIDIALRISDNQLLLYAYLQKLDVVSDDMTLTGEEKEQQLSDLRSRIRTLADTLGIDYGV